jgi:hypothetical protein
LNHHICNCLVQGGMLTDSCRKSERHGC